MVVRVTTFHEGRKHSNLVIGVIPPRVDRVLAVGRCGCHAEGESGNQDAPV
jgi:hypothetical protein